MTAGDGSGRSAHPVYSYVSFALTLSVPERGQVQETVLGGVDS